MVVHSQAQARLSILLNPSDRMVHAVSLIILFGYLLRLKSCCFFQLKKDNFFGKNLTVRKCHIWHMQMDIALLKFKLELMLKTGFKLPFLIWQNKIYSWNPPKVLQLVTFSFLFPQVLQNEKPYWNMPSIVEPFFKIEKTLQHNSKKGNWWWSSKTENH